MVNKQYNGSDFLINFYEGAYGPTIRMDISSKESVEQLKNIFLDLATARANEVRLFEVVSAKVVGIKSLVLSLVTKQEEGVLSLTEITDEGPIFHWLGSSEDWLECAELLDGILKQLQPGHQYLTNEETDDAILVVAFQEIR